jgi:hypothetical protein
MLSPLSECYSDGRGSLSGLLSLRKTWCLWRLQILSWCVSLLGFFTFLSAPKWGAGVIILSSQVMIAITTSLKPLKNKDWDNGRPGPTRSILRQWAVWPPTCCHLLWPPEHTCDWDCLTMYTFCPLLQFFLILFKAEAYVCTLKMTEDEMKCLLCLFPQCVLGSVIKHLSLPFTMSLSLVYRGKWPDLTYTWKPRSLGLMSKTLVSLPTPRVATGVL